MNKRRLWNESDRTDSPSVPSLHIGEHLIYAMILLTIVIGTILAQSAPDILESYYLVEDGILEWLTVALLLFLAGICIHRALRLRSVRPTLYPVALAVLASAFIFVAGEEISWGQRILSIETPHWLEKHNQQREITVHNLVVGDVSINHLVFGQLLTVSLVLYMFVLPWIADRSLRANRLVERLGLPLPTRLQALVFFPAAFLPELLVDSPQADEMVETCALLMFAAIFLYPKNAYIHERRESGTRTGPTEPSLSPLESRK